MGATTRPVYKIITYLEPQTGPNLLSNNFYRITTIWSIFTSKNCDFFLSPPDLPDFLCSVGKTTVTSYLMDISMVEWERLLVYDVHVYLGYINNLHVLTTMLANVQTTDRTSAFVTKIFDQSRTWSTLKNCPFVQFDHVKFRCRLSGACAYKRSQNCGECKCWGLVALWWGVVDHLNTPLPTC